jgi:chromate transporter
MGVPLGVVLREWGRIGCIGFGGPPAHVALLRELTVERRKWIDAREFEDANAACGLLPGPASTQLAIYCAQRVAGLPGALIGGAAFILPGLALVLILAAAALGSSPPDWILGVGAGAGAAVVAVVVQAGFGFARAALQDRHGALLWRGAAYLLAGAVATVLAGPWVVLVLLGCGLLELAVRGRPGPLLNLGPVAWTAFKVGALSYGGGFVIIPLMEADAVDAHGWMSHQEFLDAVAFGQLTPGPVVQTVAVIGYAADGLAGGLLAAAVAFAPSFLIVALGGARFERLRANATARGFLDGAGPAAAGAIFGAVVPLAAGIEQWWQLAVLAAAAAALFTRRAGPGLVLAAGALAGVLVALAGGPLGR